MRPRQVLLPELLIRARGERSLREMARQTGLGVADIKDFEDGVKGPPTLATFWKLVEGYDLNPEEMARAVYGQLWKPEPVSDTTAREPITKPDLSPLTA
jgi:hypothetical protein